MPLPCPANIENPTPGTDAISLLDIQNEFDGTYSIGINEYYRGGGYVQNNDASANIPTSGQISFADFFCSSGEIVVYITRDTANVNVQSLFGNYWTKFRSKRLVINSGVRVYNTNPYQISNLNGYAMRIYDTFNGKLTIQNFGSIEGASGRRGGDTIVSGESRTNVSNGGQGGNAIYIGPPSGGTANSKTIHIDNQGTIYAGGGGGGKGGSRDDGVSDPVERYFFGRDGNMRIILQGRGAGGGLGGKGQGYNQSNTSGENGNGIGVTVDIDMNLIGPNSFKFPPNSVIDIDAYSSGQISHYYSSNTNLSYNMVFSGTNGEMSFAGKNNTISINRSGSGFSGTLTKDPDQTFTDSGDSPNNKTINNVLGGGPEQTPGQISVRTEEDPNQGGSGVMDDYVVIPVPAGVVGGRGGDGATWGNTGATGGDGGSSGGASGYAIVNASQYVSYINQGTIAGQTT